MPCLLWCSWKKTLAHILLVVSRSECIVVNVCWMSIFWSTCYRTSIISINFEGTDRCQHFFWGIHIRPIIHENCDLLQMEAFQCSCVVPDARCFIFPLTNHLLWSCSLWRNTFPWQPWLHKCAFLQNIRISLGDDQHLMSYQVMNSWSTIVHNMIHSYFVSI